eukprot:TRINITY_DN2249_c0_g1_i2.p1 TRINITY_DN2249_c0_g1~~TRINITY_DN2249_c0_g1_i2.p1  ORF type:complete len:241 (+),score=65.49 TRINITY_DN2249_c0_g1_i2:76-798(+)
MAGLILYLRDQSGTVHALELDPAASVEDLRIAAQQALGSDAAPVLHYQGKSLDGGMLCDTGLSAEAMVEVMQTGIQWDLEYADKIFKDKGVLEVVDCHTVRFHGSSGWHGIRGSRSVKSGVSKFTYKVLPPDDVTPRSLRVVVGACTGRLASFYDELCAAQSWLIHPPDGECANEDWLPCKLHARHGDTITCVVDCVGWTLRFFVGEQTDDRAVFQLDPEEEYYPYVMFIENTTLVASIQ